MKKIKYIIPILEILGKTSNWFEVVSLYFKPREIVMRMTDGIQFKINNFHNLISIKEVFVNKEYLIKKIKPKTVIDIGANLGDSSVFFGLTYPKAKVIAYEPSVSVYKLLEYNLKQNNLENVLSFKLGVGSKQGKVSFYENEQSGLSSMYGTASKSKKSTISITTLTKIFKVNKIKKCDLLKVDCEGAEYDIILNMDKSTLSRINNMVIEYHEGATKHDRNDLINFLKNNKFKVKVKGHNIEKNIGIIYATK